MQNIQFWKSWPSVYRGLFILLGTVFIAATLILISAFLKSPEPSYTWEQQQELQQQDLPLLAFDVGGFDFTLSSENHILFERWSSNLIHISLESLDWYLIFFALALVTILSVFTVLKKFWYFTGMGILIFMFSSFQWEGLLLFGFGNKIPSGIIIAVMLGISLFYQYLRITGGFIERLLVFTGLLLITGICVSKFSGVSQPLHYLAIQTLPAALVIVLIFLTMVAHEIIAGFITLTNQRSGSSNNLKTFLIISCVYLLNLWLAYLNRIGWLDWNFTIAPILVFIMSGILAIWGVRQRQPQYQQIISSDPFAVFFMLSLGTISFAALGYLLSSSEDVAILSINDLILFTHIGYGMVFLAYVGANFMSLLEKNLPVQKVLYKPTTLPYFTYRFAGLIFTTAFVLYNTWSVPLSHFISSHKSAIGDYYYTNENWVMAEGYYKNAYALAPYNQHAATALAQLEANNPSKAGKYLFDANEFKPTEFTLMNYVDKLHREGKKLEEVIFLQQAINIQPKSDVLKSNLGLAYARLGMTDSAFRYFSKARRSSQMEATSDMNLLGLLAKSESQVDADSIYQQLKRSDDKVKSNAYAIANHQGRVMQMPLEFPKDSVLNLFSASLIGNYLSNHVHEADTALVAKCIALARKEVNKNFKTLILVPASSACYANGNVNRAFELLQEVIFSGIDQGKHNTTLALWAFQQQKPEVAASHLQYAIQQHYNEASLVNAVALAETGKINESIVAWDTLSTGKDSLIMAMCESMKRILAAPLSWFKDMSDNEKYRYIRYRVPLNDSTIFESLLNQMKDEDLKAKAIFDRSRKWYDSNQIGRAVTMYSKLRGLHLTNNNLFSEIKYYELLLLTAQGKNSVVNEQIKNGILFGPYRRCEGIYLEALNQDAAGDSVLAQTNFKWLAYANAYFDDGIIAAANHFKDKTGRYSSYTILSEAIQVNGRSVKILEAYVLAAIANGLDPYAIGALKTLQEIIPPNDFRAYVNKNQLQNLLLP